MGVRGGGERSVPASPRGHRRGHRVLGDPLPSSARLIFPSVRPLTRKSPLSGRAGGGPAAAYHGASPAGGHADPGALTGPSPPGAAAVSPRRFLLARPRSLPPLAAGEGRGRRAAAAHGAGKEGTRRTGGGTGLERGGTLGDGWGSGGANPTVARGRGAPSPSSIPWAPDATLVCTQRRPAGGAQPRAPRSPGDGVTLWMRAPGTRALPPPRWPLPVPTVLGETWRLPPGLPRCRKAASPCANLPRHGRARAGAPRAAWGGWTMPGNWGGCGTRTESTMACLARQLLLHNSSPLHAGLPCTTSVPCRMASPA